MYNSNYRKTTSVGGEVSKGFGNKKDVTHPLKQMTSELSKLQIEIKRYLVKGTDKTKTLIASLQRTIRREKSIQTMEQRCSYGSPVKHQIDLRFKPSSISLQRNSINPPSNPLIKPLGVVPSTSVQNVGLSQRRPEPSPQQAQTYRSELTHGGSLTNGT